MKRIILGACIAALSVSTLGACGKPAPVAVKTDAPAPPSIAGLPAGEYAMDRAHTSLNFKVSHMGFSRFTSRFTRLDGKLNLDPAHPELAGIAVDIDPASIQTNYPDPKYDFDKQLRGPEFFDTAHFPKMGFHSTKVEKTGPATARVTGDLTMHGVTRPVSLDVTFNGGYGANPMDPSGARVGFSGHGVVKRSQFGMGFGVPAPGSNMGVGDDVEVLIESEFSRAAPKAGN